MSGAAMQEVMFDHDPSGHAPDVYGVDTWEPEPVPSSLEMLRSSIPTFAATPLRLGKQMVGMAREMPTFIRASRSGQFSGALRVPRTSFNAPVTQHRTWGYCTMSLSDMKFVKNTFGVKVNDVVLAVASGSLRTYLEDRGELPETSLVASVPVNVRAEGSASTGNVISGMSANIASDIDDPVKRLLQIHENTQGAKELQQAMGADMLMGLADTPPPMMLSLALRFYGKTQLVKRLPPLFNLPISNVPGPRNPLYVQGAPIKAFYSMGIVFDGIGMFIGGMSYQDQMDFGVLACQELVDDPFKIADGMVTELNTLVKAAKSA
jgi:WS/DGAT/MGAT family acyltransferase